MDEATTAARLDEELKLLKEKLQAEETGVAKKKAELQVLKIPPAYRTDSSGQGVLTFADKAPVDKEHQFTLEITYGTPPVTPQIRDVLLKRDAEPSLPATALRGRVINAASVGLPAALVEVNGLPSQTRARRWQLGLLLST